MARIVQKFGGASVSDLKRIQAVAQQIKKSVDRGDEPVAVVSAMKGETDRLIRLARELTLRPDQREYDALVCSGEQVTAALLAIALQNLGVRANSLLAYQIRILTDSVHQQAKIQEIDGSRLLQALETKTVPVVAGFQGIDALGDLTTLGRGGTDLTAVAVASAIKADRCEFFKDVDGVSTADPSICRDAQMLKKTSYEEMMEIASSGAKVLQTRAVLLARNLGVKLVVKSCLHPDQPGTTIVSEDKLMEKPIVSAITIDKNEARIGIEDLPDQPGVAADLFASLSEKQIFVDMIVHNTSESGTTALAFTVPKDQAEEAYSVVETLKNSKGWGTIDLNTKVAKISAIGAGMRTHSGVASKMFRVLADEGVNIIMIGTSEIRISCLIEEKYAELALQTLHDAFNLGKRATA